MEWHILGTVFKRTAEGGSMFTTVLSSDAQRALALLGKSGLVADAYLAGGSALALHYGHRISVDFDFFSPNTFDPITLGQSLAALGDFTQEVAKGTSLIGTFRGIKMNYFQYDYPLVAPSTRQFNVEIAGPKDIAAMKLVAITDRSTKKDFIDLFTLTHKDMTLDTMFTLYEQKYHVFESNKFTLIKSMTYFEEADADDMPRMLTPLSWEEVKRFFIAESMRLGKKYLKQR